MADKNLSTYLNRPASALVRDPGVRREINQLLTGGQSVQVYDSYNELPGPEGLENVLYLTADTSRIYYWDGAAYTEAVRLTNALSDAADTMIERAINGVDEDTPFITLGNDYNHPSEFGIIQRADSTFVLVYTEYSTGVGEVVGTRIVTAPTLEALDARIGNPAYDKSLGVPAAGYPGVLEEAGILYVYFYLVAGNAIDVMKGATADDVIASDVHQVNTDMIDPCVIKNPKGGFLMCGYAINDGAEYARMAIWSSPSPDGKFVFENYVYPEEDRPAFFRGMADPSIFTIGNRLFGMCHGVVYENYDLVNISHCCIFEINNEKGNYTALTPPIQFHDAAKAWQLYPSDLAQCGDPVRLKTLDGQEYIFYNNQNYIGRMAIPATLEVPYSGHATTGDVVRIQGGVNREVTSNIPFNVLGTVTNTTLGGITASGSNSVVFGYVNLRGVSYFKITCIFKVGTLPSSGQGTVWRLISKNPGVNQSQISFDVFPDGTSRVTFKNAAGTSAPFNFPNNLVPGDTNTLELSISVGSGLITGQLNNVGSSNNSNPGVGAITDLERFSLFNTKTILTGFGNQFLGTIHSLLITREDGPAESPYTLDQVLAEGNTSTRDLSIGQLTSTGDYQVIGPDGSKIKVVANGVLAYAGAAGGTAPYGQFWGGAISVGPTYFATQTPGYNVIAQGYGKFDAGIRATLPAYADDAAADADSTLPSGALYKITGNRQVYQKP